MTSEREKFERGLPWLKENLHARELPLARTWARFSQVEWELELSLVRLCWHLGPIGKLGEGLGILDMLERTWASLGKAGREHGLGQVGRGIGFAMQAGWGLGLLGQAGRELRLVGWSEVSPHGGGFPTVSKWTRSPNMGSLTQGIEISAPWL